VSGRAGLLLQIAVALLIVLVLLYAQDLREPVIGMWGCSGSIR